MQRSASKNLCLYIVASLTIFVILAACNRNKQTEEQNYLTLHPWFLRSTEQEIDGKWVTENIDSCKKDNLYVFQVSGIFTISSGATKCQAGDPDELASGSWRITKEGDRLLAKVLGNIRDLEILTLNSSSMVLVLTKDGRKTRETYSH